MQRAVAGRISLRSIGPVASSLSDLNANPLISLKLRILAFTKILSNINHLLI
jgi:hypothetical protein